MSRNLFSRLAKVEAGRASVRRLVPIFNIGGDKAQIASQKAEMFRKGEASPEDNFVTFVTIYEDAPTTQG